MRFHPRSAKKSGLQKKKITAKHFPAKIYSTVDILMVDIGYGRIESDSEDEEEYRLEDENTIDNPVDNAPSVNVVIVDPIILSWSPQE